MNNFLFFGHPMHLQYARTKSDIVAKIDGTFQEGGPAAGKRGAEGDEKPRKRQPKAKRPAEEVQ